MKKTIRIGVIALLFLFYFNMSAIAASDYTPWKLHKESAQEVMLSIRAYFHEESINPEQTWERVKEERSIELEALLDKEKTEIISEVRNYGEDLETQIDDLLEKQSVKDIYATYEIERNEQVYIEVQEEISAYLSELLSKK